MSYEYMEITDNIFILKNQLQIESEREAIHLLYQNNWQLNEAIENYIHEPHRYYEENDILKDMEWDDFLDYMMLDYYEYIIGNRNIFNNNHFDANWEYNSIFPKRKLEDYIMEDYEEKIMDQTQVIECPICYKTLKKGLSTTCIHRFCENCINQWLIIHKKDFCPMCKRKDISLFYFEQ